MQSVGSFFSSVTKFYSELNPATLSGAIDVVVVEQPNGDLACSPFHVRFGKLSILRPQDKVVEVTINGRVVDFPMKVGDAGEAFFVFETEQEVPEEFATSPLAGPIEGKTEEDIDFLDLAQGSRDNKSNNAPQQEEQDTGYVSAHSGHGSEFEDDDMDIPTPELGGKQDYFALDNSTDRKEGRKGNAPIKSRLSISVSLPCSPILKAHDIAENTEQVDSAGPFGEYCDTQLDEKEDQFSISELSSAMGKNNTLNTYQDQVIMDMTGYKTDNSVDTDIDSDKSLEVVSRANRQVRRKRGKTARPNLGFSVSHQSEQNQNINDIDIDSRFPVHPMDFRNHKSHLGLKMRSASLPNLRETGYIKVSSSQRLNSGRGSHLRNFGEDGLGLTSLSTNSPETLDNSQQHHRQHDQDGTIKSKPRRRPHKPTELTHVPKTVSRPNLALSALSDTELEYQTPRSSNPGQDSEWSWGWGSLPVKNESVEEIEQHTDHVSTGLSSHPKPVLNEMEVDGVIYRVAISLCPGDDFGKDLEASEAIFATNQISFDEFAKDPLKILNNKSLVCLINDRYFTWLVAGPYLASLILFKKPLSDETLEELSIKDARHLSGRLPIQEAPTRFGVISRWFRGSQSTIQADTLVQEQSPSSPIPDGPLREYERTNDGIDRHSDKELITRRTSLPVDTEKPDPTVEERNNKRYAKTLRLTSEQLRSLNLKKGANTLTFSVTSSYQGMAVCSAKLFLWDHDVQVVISDIDGTITKSDALGHIFTMAGKDWTHAGVAKLYTDIVNNGYHILYLTSRAIGQADYTRKEVILRKPEEFKMACLRDIKRLFGDRNPFYAGFGNRITDALSYRSVGVASSHIFSIDPRGEVKLELLSTFKSSYLALNDLVHEIFPGKRQAPEFNDWNYWKPALPAMDLPMAPSQHPTLPLNPVDINTNSGISGGSGRLGVIRSLTSTFTSSGPLKRRPSIPSFNSVPSGTPTTPLPGQTPPRSLTPLSMTPSSPPLPLPLSAPAGFQIADRTRRLSLSLMKYGSSAGLVPSSTSPSSSNPSEKIQTVEITTGDQRTRARGMSMNSTGYIPSNLGTSPPTSFDSSTPSDAAVHPLDIKAVKRTSGFSVSPPQIASRLTEAVIPFLRGRSSKSEQGQSQEPGISKEYEKGPIIHDEPDEPYTYYEEEEDDEDEYDGQADDDGGVYEDAYGDENIDEDDDEDVELNIDAPFL
ncbi:hypothetical protein BGZ49_000478 [Haplosporangium sp. Z 27]|nr:hypothetical protein BGZ49_000478 [Haplosporangium sp. Z 27]